MAVIASFRDLIVWQRSTQLALAVYQLTAAFPREELFGLTSQLRRASVSIASNIAEGYGRKSRGEYKQFVGIARGSNLEVQTQLYIASELAFGATGDLKHCEQLSAEIERMLNSLMAKL